MSSACVTLGSDWDDSLSDGVATSATQAIKNGQITNKHLRFKIQRTMQRGWLMLRNQRNTSTGEKYSSCVHHLHHSRPSPCAAASVAARKADVPARRGSRQIEPRSPSIPQQLPLYLPNSNHTNPHLISKPPSLSAAGLCVGLHWPSSLNDLND